MVRGGGGGREGGRGGGREGGRESGEGGGKRGRDGGMEGREGGRNEVDSCISVRFFKHKQLSQTEKNVTALEAYHGSL